MSERLSEATHVWTARLVGWLGVAAFVGISTIHGGFEIEYHGPFNRFSLGEANLWLASALLLFPACCALGFGYRSLLASLFAWVRAQVAALSSRERLLATGCLTLLALASARVFNHMVLLGYPVTDDEWSVRFGGEVLATGRLISRLPFLKEAFPTLFMFIQGNNVTSFDWIGVQIPWAIAALTHTGNWIFAVQAALPVPCLMWLLSKRIGPSWALVGAALFFASPMAFALSLSTHAHLASRALIALALALYVQERRGLVFVHGLALGLAITCRPFETCFLLAPLYLGEAWRALRNPALRLPFLIFALGVALPLVGFFAHAYAMTGTFTPPRHSPQAVAAPITELSYWVRFGSNSAFNALRLAVFFAGPLGLVLIAAGALVDRFTALLALGVLSVLGLGLFHDNYGVHLVGPIHYSECAVPLTVIAVHGLHRITRAWQSAGFSADVPLAVTALWLLIGLGAFNALHARGLHERTLIQATIYEYIEEKIPPKDRPAVLFAPLFANVWTDVPAFRKRGSWVFEWRRPKPDFSDDILILLNTSGPAMGTVRTAWPERHYFYLHRGGPETWFTITTEP